jgi:hypothetical protein
MGKGYIQVRLAELMLLKVDRARGWEVVEPLRMGMELLVLVLGVLWSTVKLKRKKTGSWGSEGMIQRQNRGG